MRVEILDHLVLTVQDVEASVDFYTRVLGMEAVTFQDGRRAVRFGDQKINFHQRGREFEPKAERPTPGSADLCFLVDESVEEVARDLSAMRVDVFLGPVARSGALGEITSIYLRDPDGNLIELSNYRDGVAPE